MEKLNFESCSFLEAMEGLNQHKKIRFVGLPENQFFQIDLFGKVSLHYVESVRLAIYPILRSGLAIMRLNEQWQIEKKDS